MILRTETEEDEHNEWLLLEGCSGIAAHIAERYREGHTLESMGLSVRNYLCRLQEKNLLEYLPRRKRPNHEWIEGSWR